MKLPIGSIKGPFTLCVLASALALPGSAVAQGLVPPPAADLQHAPITGTVQADIVNSTLNSINDASPDTQPIDLLPVEIPSRTSRLDTMKEGALYFLPAKMFLNASVENSLRLETNIYQTSNHYRQDMIYRVMPNITLGYALTRRTRVSANYFLLRDQYAFHSGLMSRNIQSVGFEVDHDIPLTRKTTLTTGLLTRELFITNAEPMSDIIPSATLVRRVGEGGILYSSVMGQLRWRSVFSRWQEGDQFYTVGYAYRKNLWALSANTTLVSNFGNSNLRGGGNNQMIIQTVEVDRQLNRKLPLCAFVRVQPIYNMGANQSPGFAGVNFRVYGGLRLDVSKPALFPPKAPNAYKLAKQSIEL